MTRLRFRSVALITLFFYTFTFLSWFGASTPARAYAQEGNNPSASTTTAFMAFKSSVYRVAKKVAEYRDALAKPGSDASCIPDPAIRQLRGLEQEVEILYQQMKALLDNRSKIGTGGPVRGALSKEFDQKAANWRSRVRGLVSGSISEQDPAAASRLLNDLRYELLSAVDSRSPLPPLPQKVPPAPRKPRMSPVPEEAPRAAAGATRDLPNGRAPLGQAARTVMEDDLQNVLSLYQEVRNTLRFELYYGSRKGGKEALAEGGGNAFDIASALALRLNGFPVRYVYGTVDMAAEDVMNWVGGVDTPEIALSVLEKSGIPAQGLPEGGPCRHIRMEHLWLEVALGYEVETGESVWHPLDPSFKLYQDHPGIDWADFNQKHPPDAFVIPETMDLNLLESYGSGLNSTLFAAETTKRAEALTSYLHEMGKTDATVGDVLGYREIVPDNSQALPESLPFEVVSVLWRETAIPAAYRDRMTIDWFKGPDETSPAATYSLYLDEIAGDILSLYYVGVNHSQEEALGRWDGGNYDYIEVAPRLRFGFRPTAWVDATHYSGNEMGSEERLGVTYDFADGAQKTEKYAITAGSLYVFGFNFGQIPQNRIQERVNYLHRILYGAQGSQAMADSPEPTRYPRDDPKPLQALPIVSIGPYYSQLYSPYVLGEVAALLADGYFLQTSGLSLHQAATSRIIRVNTFQQGLFSCNIKPLYFLGKPWSVEGFGGVSVDIKINRWWALSAAGDPRAEWRYRLFSGIIASFMEGNIIEQLGLPGVSTMHFFQHANHSGMKIHVVDAGNLSEKLTTLNHHPSDVAQVTDAVSKGMVVIIPQSSVAVGEIEDATGFAIIDPATGNGAFMITKMLGGGESTFRAQRGQGWQMFLSLIFPWNNPFVALGIIFFFFNLLTVGGLLMFAGLAYATHQAFRGVWEPVKKGYQTVDRISQSSVEKTFRAPSGVDETGVDRLLYLVDQVTLGELMENQLRMLLQDVYEPDRPDPGQPRPVRDSIVQAVTTHPEHLGRFLSTLQSVYGYEAFSGLRPLLSDEQLVKLALSFVDFRGLHGLLSYLEGFYQGTAFFKEWVARACRDVTYAGIGSLKNWQETVDEAFAGWIALKYPLQMEIPSPDWIIHNTRLGESTRGFYYTSGVAASNNGVTYVIDALNEEVGAFTAPFDALSFRFGASGTENDALRKPHGIAVSLATGNVYVADTGNHRIRIFDAMGNGLSILEGLGGSGGKLLAPHGLFVDEEQMLYVADTGNHRICVFDPEGAFLREFGGYGNQDGALIRPQGVVVDTQGNIYVADTGNHRIVKFDNQGQWVWSVGALGSDPGAGFVSPRGIGLGRDGNLYVCDTYNYRVQAFTVDGEFIACHYDQHLSMPAHISFDPVDAYRYVGNDGGATEKFYESPESAWNWSSHFTGTVASDQRVDFAYRDQDALRIVEIAVANKMLKPEDVEHYITHEGGEYRFDTHDLFFWSFGSKLIHPVIEEEIRRAISDSRLVLDIWVVPANRDPLSPELMTLDGRFIPAHHWISGEFLGNVKVNVSAAPRPVRRGDVDDSGFVNLADAIMALQICINIQPSSDVYREADASGNQSIGLQEALFILQVIAGWRPNSK